MNETNQTYFIKQVWRQKGDAPFAEIPFKEENKAAELSQTTAPVLLLETKANGGSGAVFAIGRVAKHAVVEQVIEYPGGEYHYHVPFQYEFTLADKKAGISREELQELSGQKFAPQVKGGLYEIDASLFVQLEALLRARAGGQAVKSTKATKASTEEKTPKAKSPAKKEVAKNPDGLLQTLSAAVEQLQAHPELRAVIENGQVAYYPAVLLESTTDRIVLQQTISEYVAAPEKAGIDKAAQEAAAAATTAASPRFAKIIGLVERLVREGKYDSVQVPTTQKAFYQTGKLPHPYHAIELQGAQGYHVLGTDGTLYTIEGKTVQHFLGL